MHQSRTPATQRLLLGLSLAATGCVTAPSSPRTPRAPHDFPSAGTAAAATPAWLSLRPIAGPSGFRVGEGAVFSLRLQTGSSTRRWFVIATLASVRPRDTAFASVVFPSRRELKFELVGLVRFHIRVVEPDGTLVGESITGTIPTESLTTGLVRAAAFCFDRGGLDETRIEAAIDAVDPATRRATIISFAAIQPLVELALQNESLAPLLEACIRRPSLTALLTGFLAGTQILFDVRNARPHLRRVPVPVTRAYEIPLQVEAFGEVVLRGSALVAASSAPLHLSAGIVSLVGAHPDQPDHAAQLRLVRFGRLPEGEIRRIVALEKATPKD